MMSWVVPGWGVRLLGGALLLLGVVVHGGILYRRALRPTAAPPPAVAVRPEMMVLPPGTFQMGSQAGAGDEQPRHPVQITHRFAIAATEVTQEQYQQVVGKNPSRFVDPKRPDLPVENVSWLDAIDYCNKLTELEQGLTKCYARQGDDVKWQRDCTGYRLPTEAEWEYAARADQETEYAGSEKPDDVAWYKDNSGGKTHPVAELKQNAWQLYDMSGNVWEWVWDWYADKYNPADKVDPMGPPGGSYRVYRGGSWFADAIFARVAYRGYVHPAIRYGIVGFRVARSFP